MPTAKEMKESEKELRKRGVKASYDPDPDSEEDDDLPLAKNGGNADEDLKVADVLATMDMADFLNAPCDKRLGSVQCYIERNKSGSRKVYPEYHLYLKEGDRFLLASKKRPKNRTSNYTISMDKHDLARHGGSFVGKLRSNFIGTEFQVYDKGLNPKNADPEALAVKSKTVRQELASIMYASNLLGSRGPRKMKVCLPEVKEDGSRVVWRPTRKSDEMIQRFKDQDMTGLIKLINKPPRWNDQVGAYVLNFSGRVTMASVKNFQLVSSDNHDEIILQFGRVGKDLFTMDYSYPMSPMQAFAICLSSFDSKLACE